MYLNHYDLTNKPFSISPDPNFLWPGEKHAEALAGLQYGILENKGFVLLTGEIGTGKTLLINSLVKSINEEVILATIPDPRLELIDFYNILANKFKMDRRFERKGDFLIHFEEFLIKANGHHKKVLLIIDEAQRLKSELLDEIRVLSNIEFETRKLINIFFVGQRELKEMLLEERNWPLKQRITYNYHLMPLVEQETAAFIEHRLKVAGATKKIFSKEAIREIHNFSKGVPRLINIICDHSLMTGYSNTLTVIDVDVINECSEELQISVAKSLPFSKQPTAVEDDPWVQVQEIIKYLQKPKPSEKPSILKVAGIIAIIIIFGGMAISFFYNSRFQQSDNRLKQNNEILKSEDATKISKSPLMIADSKGDTQDTLTDKFSADRVEIDKNDEEIIIHKDQSENNNEGIITLKDPKFNEIEEFKEFTASKNPEVDLPRKESSKGRNLIENDLKKPTVKEVDQSSKPTGGGQFLSFSEHKFVIHFKLNSADLDSQIFEKLNNIAKIVSKNPDSDIIIEGYTDSYGDYYFNKKLSQFRCNIVESYLIAKGVANSSITAIGFGSDRPVGDNKTREGRRKNRRVEIKVKIRFNIDLLL
jgi:general secretion pathway protein A